MPFGTLYFCKIQCILSKYTVFCKFQCFVPNAIFSRKKNTVYICQIQSYRSKPQSENSVFCKKYSGLQNKNKYSSLNECTEYRTDAEIRYCKKIQQITNLFGTLHFDRIQSIFTYILQRVYFYFCFIQQCIFLLCVNRT